MERGSIQSEVHPDVYFHCNRVAVEHRRLEFVLLHGVDCFLVQTLSQVTYYVDTLRVSLCVHNQ
jgi:hypothetical protein